jgi:hypothetical protein
MLFDPRYKPDWIWWSVARDRDDAECSCTNASQVFSTGSTKDQVILYPDHRATLC